MNVELSPEQKRALEAQHRKCRDRRVCDRIRCVLLSAEGWSASMIAKSQLIDETTVRRHLHDWLNEQKLTPENGCSESHLSEAQTAELITCLTDNLLPTTQSIIELIDEWWDIRYTVPGMNKWLHRNDFSYKKPTGVPHKYSAEAQRAFVEIYKKLKQEAGDEPILFIDGVHPTQGTELAYGWMPKGQKTIVKITGSRPRLNIMGALNLNLIEWLWKVMNEVVRNNRYFASSKQFQQEIHYLLCNKLPVLAGALSRRINDNFQCRFMPIRLGLRCCSNMQLEVY